MSERAERIVNGLMSIGIIWALVNQANALDAAVKKAFRRSIFAFGVDLALEIAWWFDRTPVLEFAWLIALAWWAFWWVRLIRRRRALKKVTMQLNRIVERINARA